MQYNCQPLYSQVFFTFTFDQVLILSFNFQLGFDLSSSFRLLLLAFYLFSVLTLTTRASSSISIPLYIYLNVLILSLWPGLDLLGLSGPPGALHGRPRPHLWPYHRHRLHCCWRPGTHLQYHLQCQNYLDILTNRVYRVRTKRLLTYLGHCFLLMIITIWLIIKWKPIKAQW